MRVVLLTAASALHYPPCIRVMVRDSQSLQPGDLYVITCSGATIGRAEDLGHAIVIPDANVNKVGSYMRAHEESYLRKYMYMFLGTCNVRV